MMKRLSKILIAIAAVMVMALGVIGFTACGGETPAAITSTHSGYENTVVAREIPREDGTTATLVSGNNKVVNVKLYDDNSYELHIVYQSVYNTPMTTIDVTIYGSSYTLAEEDGGYRKLTLTKASADRTIIYLNIMNGMFVKYWDTETTTFPTTMVGDDVTQISKEELLEKFESESYGSITADHTYYIAVEADGSLSAGLVFNID